jgi:hypothetical protein
MTNISYLSALYSNFFTGLSKKISFSLAWQGIMIFYLFVLFYGFNKVTYLLSNPIQSNFLALWPVYWMNYFPKEAGIILISLGVLISTLLTVLKSDLAIFRLLTFLSLLQLEAYLNSFGKINHAEHLLILIAFILIFLPNKKNQTINQKISFVKVFFSCQLIIMLTYTLSGFWKIETGITQMLDGQIGSFHPLAMAYQIAGKLSETNESSLLANLFIKNIWLSWPLYLGSIYLEIFAIYAVFKPDLHKIWGVFLILFHIFVYLSMAIPFSFNIFLLGLFFIYSPFAPEKFSLKAVLKQLLLVDIFIKLKKF